MPRRQGQTPAAPVPNPLLVRRFQKLGRLAQAEGPGRHLDPFVFLDAGDGLFQGRPAEQTKGAHDGSCAPFLVFAVWRGRPTPDGRAFCGTTG